MKKSFLFLILIAAMAMVVVSCMKEDDKITAEEFADKMVGKNSTSFTWEGNETTQAKSMGSWYDKGSKWAVMRFDRSTPTATEGTGKVLYFKNSYKDELRDDNSLSEFTWRFWGDELIINYRHTGWDPVHAEYNTTELIIDSNGFKGTWFESSDTRFTFSYIKSNFNDWAKYGL